MADLESQLLTTDPEVLGLQRQRKLADLLTSGAFEQPQGQMISGRYVAPSALQQALPMIQAAIGGLTNANLDTKQQALAEALRGKQMETMQAYANAKSPQEKLAALMSPYAPKMLQAAGAEMFKPQKLGEGETISQLNFGTGQYEPMAQGGQKIAPEVRQAMQMLGINKPFEQLTPQEVNAIRNEALAFKKAGAVSINMPSESERKAGTMVNILDKNLLQMQTALGVDPNAVKPNVPASVVEAIAGPNLLSRSMKPAQRQIIEDSQLDVLDAALTLRTGAAYTKEQLEGMRDTYFPKLGDKPAAIAAKKQRLETLLDSAYISAGRATPPRVSAPYTAQPTQPNINKELNIPSTGLPKGVSLQLWNVMTPEEKAAFK